MRFDPRLYLVTDPQLCAKQGIVESVRQAVAGGVTLVQLRDKESPLAVVAEAARALVSVLKPLGIPLILNDYVELVAEVGAQGVHIGKKDSVPSQARKRLPAGSIVGVSIEHGDTIDLAALSSVDYLAASPVFKTATKLDCSTPFGLEGLRALRSQTDLPLVAIGGVQLENAPSLFEAGANGVAVVSAILGQSNITEAARAFRECIERKVGNGFHE
jgi:thiamine-phosphate pyrophosphorylase